MCNFWFLYHLLFLGKGKSDWDIRYLSFSSLDEGINQRLGSDWSMGVSECLPFK